ncbi:MAG TPA: hypothetical protein VNO14_04885 [Blastocatellia bacterium]|nr:hypothetical protein [Blastocatellia bacterium]
MNAKTFTSTVLCILLALPSLALAQDAAVASSDWSAVLSISPGEKLSVNLKDGKKFEGRLLRASDTTLIIDRKGRSTDLDRQSIQRVHRLVPKSTGKSIGKSALIGAGIGFGAGATLGIAAGSYEDLETAGLVGILGGIGAAIGAGIGAITGAITGRGNKKVLVYDAR